MESTLSQIEKEKMVLQHKINDYQRKIEQENEKRRNVENEGMPCCPNIDTDEVYDVFWGTIYYLSILSAMQL